MSSMIGERLRVSIFGESHGTAIGVVMDGLPAGEAVDITKVQVFLARRAPGAADFSTARRETDAFEVLSGLVRGVTCGAPLCAVIRNTDACPAEYAALSDTPRPGHADYPARVKFGGFEDARGGGHLSGRLTAPLCFAGAVAQQLLLRRGVAIGAHAYAIGQVQDAAFDAASVTASTLQAVAQKPFPVLDDDAGARMQQAIKNAAAMQDSIGGIIECAVTGMPAGVGEPMFGGVENRLSATLFGIPAVKGVEFGNGFAAAAMLGSENNDAYVMDGDTVKTKTNCCGGILGGITTGMPLLFRVAIKPTPSIGKEQDMLRLPGGAYAKIAIAGRHDPCIVPRATPCVEAAAAVTLLDMLLCCGK